VILKINCFQGDKSSGDMIGAVTVKGLSGQRVVFNGQTLTQIESWMSRTDTQFVFADGTVPKCLILMEKACASTMFAGKTDCFIIQVRLKIILKNIQL
jgi:hypothetical protein